MSSYHEIEYEDAPMLIGGLSAGRIDGVLEVFMGADPDIGSEITSISVYGESLFDGKRQSIEIRGDLYEHIRKWALQQPSIVDAIQHAHAEHWAHVPDERNPAHLLMSEVL